MPIPGQKSCYEGDLSVTGRNSWVSPRFFVVVQSGAFNRKYSLRRKCGTFSRFGQARWRAARPGG